MLEPDWNQERPSLIDATAIWQDSVFASAPVCSSGIEELLKEFRATHVNGGAEFGRFTFAIIRNLHWFVSRNRFDEIHFIEHLLCSNAFRETLPQIRSPISIEPIKWEWCSPYLIAGDWARALMAGGAYKSFNRGGRAALTIAERARFALFEDRFEDVQIYRASVPWSAWFFDVAWDMTWVGIDKRDFSAWVLCLTDTD
jgi:hypothetical protein